MSWIQERAVDPSLVHILGPLLSPWPRADGCTWPIPRSTLAQYCSDTAFSVSSPCVHTAGPLQTGLTVSGFGTVYFCRKPELGAQRASSGSMRRQCRAQLPPGSLSMQKTSPGQDGVTTPLAVNFSPCPARSPSAGSRSSPLLRVLLLIAVIMYTAWKTGTAWACSPSLGGAMATGFPAITPNNGHSLVDSSTWAEAPRGAQASLGAAALSFLLGTNYGRA